MENNQFVTDSELTNYLNDSLSILDAILVSKFSDYKLTKSLVSVVAGTNYISLPNDFLKFRGIDVYFNPGQQDGYYKINEYGWAERDKRIFPAGGPTGGIISPYVFEYRLEGAQITIIPPQLASSYQYRLNYAPDYIALVNPTDTLPAYMDTQNWRQYAIYDSAAQVLAKQDLDPGFFMAQADRMKQHLVELATPNRDSGEPKSVGLGDRGNSGGIPYGLGW
jgi:hypothetical protein